MYNRKCGVKLLSFSFKEFETCDDAKINLDTLKYALFFVCVCTKNICKQ